MIVGSARFEFGELLELLHRPCIFILRQQRARQAVAVPRIVWVLFNSVPVGLLSVRKILGLRVRVAQQVVNIRRRGIHGRLLEQFNRFLQLPFVNQDLAQLVERLPQIRIAVQESAKQLFSLLSLVYPANR